MTAKETTSVEAGAVSVPYGHVIGNEKWRGSQIARGLQGKIKLILEDGLGFVDFHLSNRSCILYISEADLVAGNGFKRRLVRFRNASSLHGIVIVEKTQISDQYFPAVQKFIVLELGMTLLPVANQGEASQLIIQLAFDCEKTELLVIKIRSDKALLKELLQSRAQDMKASTEEIQHRPDVHEQSKDHTSNPFLHKKCSQLAEASILRTVQQIPGVGKTKALLLLQQFVSIHQLCNASVQDLELVVGQTIAQQIHAFFTQTK